MADRSSIDHAGIASSMLYEYRLNTLGKEFAARNLSPLIVKGLAIVDLAFPKDEFRLSSDVDLLVGEDANNVVSALLDLGFKEKPVHSKHFALGERVFLHDGARLPGVVEVHNCLDKVLLRPIPYSDILARALPSSRVGFLYPTVEDLLLLVVLHASSDIYFNQVRVERDLQFLINNGKPDMDIVKQHAEDWELSKALSRLMSGDYPKKYHSVRRSNAIDTFLFFVHQFMWHDSAMTVVRGIIKYAYARLRDRFF